MAAYPRYAVRSSGGAINYSAAATIMLFVIIADKAVLLTRIPRESRRSHLKELAKSHWSQGPGSSETLTSDFELLITL